ncbi:MAG: 50S ribosomal protein L9 [Candidatus Omnitrophota bacterium]
MEVILIKDVEKLGFAGTVVKTKDGFARNFLIPNNLAVLLTAANQKRLEQEKLKKAQGLEKIKKSCEEIKGRLDNLSLTISALVQEDEKLYASITPQIIVSSLKDEGFEIDKNAVLLAEPIKALGIYEAEIKLHPEVSAKIKVWIVKK